MFDLSILTNYSFLSIALGTVILAFTAGSIGCISVIKGESLIGDAIGHSSFPGIIFMFMLFSTREPAILLLGAFLSGALAYFYIQIIKDYSFLKLDAILAITLSTFFGLGMVLKTYIQGNPDFQGASQSGLQNYIFGQAAYILRSDIYIMIGVSIIALVSLILFYKEIKLYLFDEEYAQIIGINRNYMHIILLITTMFLIAAGIKLVGAILISAFLILPAIIGLQWSNHFSKVLLIAACSSSICALIGTYISSLYKGMSTGPTIIIVMSLTALFSLLLGKNSKILKNILISTGRCK